MDKNVLLVGGIVAAGLVLVLFLKNQQQSSQAAINGAGFASGLSVSSGDNIGDVLSSIGNSFGGSGGLGDLGSLFSGSIGGSNDPGLVDPTDSLNDPGLESDYSD